MNYNLYFQRSNDTYFMLGTNLSTEECTTLIHKFILEHNFRSYYTRSTVIPDNVILIDVGSWSEFFLEVPMDEVPNFETDRSITEYIWKE